MSDKAISCPNCGMTNPRYDESLSVDKVVKKSIYIYVVIGIILMVVLILSMVLGLLLV